MDKAQSESADNYEDRHVHAVYEEIAEHFSATRYKPWPIVEDFLLSLRPGSIGLDVGCGNGKYLTVNPAVFIIGSDRSPNLVKIAANHQPHSVTVADILGLPHAKGTFDFAISIAVIHHLSTAERRIEALACIIDVLKPNAHLDDTESRKESRVDHSGGTALIYVWALEQKNSRRGWDADGEQDVMVPWILKSRKLNSKDGPRDKIYQRYYHLYRSGELELDVIAAGGKVLSSGYEKDNWWAIVAPGPQDIAPFSEKKA